MHNQQKITIRAIIEHAADMFNCTAADLTGRSKCHPVSLYRQVAMAVARQLTTASYTMIGRAFDNRDHATVIQSIASIKADPETDQWVANLVAFITGPESIGWTEAVQFKSTRKAIPVEPRPARRQNRGITLPIAPWEVTA